MPTIPKGLDPADRQRMQARRKTALRTFEAMSVLDMAKGAMDSLSGGGGDNDFGGRGSDFYDGAEEQLGAFGGGVGGAMEDDGYRVGSLAGGSGGGKGKGKGKGSKKRGGSGSGGGGGGGKKSKRH
jgi:hypothetical protein